MPKLTISKLDAAKRQLETAIVLYFQEADPVAIHTLSAAAHAILDDLSVHRKQEPTLHRQMDTLLRPEYKKDFRARIHRARNFFKHANTDPDASLDFDPHETEPYLLDGALAYSRLAGERPPLLRTYVMWAALTWAKGGLTYPDTPPEVFERQAQRAQSMSRRDFFDEAIPAAYRASNGRLD